MKVIQVVPQAVDTAKKLTGVRADVAAEKKQSK